MKNTTKLKNILVNSNTDFFLEAHNALSAKIVSEVGFQGIWASGLSIATSCGVRDRNEISWTEVLEIVERMTDIVDIPVLLDGDSGFGDFNNVRRLVKKSEQKFIAGICIEDKIFPKTNSFLTSKNQKLVSINEFCGKIKAAKDTQIDSDFCIIARTESLIIGNSIEQSIERCTYYAESGADAILIHSKYNSYEQICSFMNKWSNLCPVVIVPTTFPYERLYSDIHKISLVIWANHLIRACILQMQNVAKLIHENQNIICIENKIASMKELFRLQNVSELEQAEQKYL